MTLTAVATWTKRGILVSGLIIFISIAGLIGYSLWYNYYLSKLPPPEEKPEMKFGALPNLKFPESKDQPTYTYSLDTVTGNLPQTPKVGKVYFMPQGGLTLLATEKSRQLAERLGFKYGPVPLTKQLYRYSENISSNTDGILTIDLATNNFSFTRMPVPKKDHQATATSSAESIKDLANSNDHIAYLKNYLELHNLLPEALKKGRGEVANNPSTSQYPTKIVSLWPEDIDQMQIITATPSSSLIRAVLGDKNEIIDPFLKIDYTFWPVDLTTYSTYPLKDPMQAFAQLQQNKGYISLKPKTTKVSIANLRLAYYQSDQYTPYLQPIFVFEGPDFVGLVPAVSQESDQPITPTK